MIQLRDPTPVEFEEELVGEPVEQQPAQVASLQLRPLASGSGTAAIWRSLEPDLDGAIIRRVLSSSLVDAWEGASVRFDTLDHFFTFSSALVHSPVSADFQETPSTEFGALDADFFNTFQAAFPSIQSSVTALGEQVENQPVPPPPLQDNTRFYRLERTFPDSDGDGIPDYIEIRDGLDPYSKDTDGDGDPDSLEVIQGTNPNDAYSFNPLRDSDLDGIYDVDEMLAGTALDDSSDFPLRMVVHRKVQNLNLTFTGVEGINHPVFSNYSTTPVETVLDLTGQEPPTIAEVRTSLESENVLPFPENSQTLEDLILEESSADDDDRPSFRLKGEGFHPPSLGYLFDHIATIDHSSLAEIYLEVSEPPTTEQSFHFLEVRKAKVGSGSNVKEFMEVIPHEVEFSSFEGKIQGQSSSITLFSTELPSSIPAENVDDAYDIDVSLLPVEIVPDYNRDGKITSADRGQISEENPFRWWVNDDDDRQNEEIADKGTDTPAQAPIWADWNNASADGLRDLVDFFPLHLDLKSVLETLPLDEYHYFLKHESGAVKFFEQPDTILEEDEDNQGPAAYLRNLTKAKELAVHPLMHVNAAGVQLSEEILEAFKMGKGTLVCELTNTTESPLVLEIRKTSGESLAEIEFPIKASSVEDMYRHANVRRIAADGGTGGLRTQLGDPGDAYPDELTNGDYFVFVHGFNVDPDAARGWHAEIFKRLHQLGSRTRFIGVSWHGDVGDVVPDYHRAVRNAFRTSRTLNTFLPDEPDAKVTIAAHSLGNMVVGNAIEREGLEVDTYFMINAATPIEAYDSSQKTGVEAETLNSITMQPRMTEDRWKPYDERLFASNWWKRFPDNDGRFLNLKWADRFGEKVPDLAYNFYSTGEDVVENADPRETFLANAAIEIFNKFVRHAWTQNEIMKGNALARTITGGTTHAGWDFYYNPPNQFVAPSGYWERDGGILFPNYRMWLPSEALNLLPNEVKSKPFHTPFNYEKLYDLEEGSEEAAKEEVQFDLLSSAIPALSFAAGANPLEVLNPDQGENRNFNMMELKNGGWPRGSGDWVHSDFRDVAFSYVLPMYEEMIFEGGLDR